VVLLHNEDSHEAAYLGLRDYIPVKVDPEWQDFGFQLNVPKRLRPEMGVEYINRLSKWNAFRVRTGRMLLSKEAIIQPPLDADRFGIRLEVDISTPGASFTALPKANLVSIYHELVAGSNEVAREGVIYDQLSL
jgi:hypothetical protein